MNHHRIILKTALFVIACVATTALFLACTTSPAGQYSTAKVQKGLKAAASKGIINAAQADQVAGEIASAPEGFDWGQLATVAGGVVSTLALGYVGLKPALGRIDNEHILGADEAAALASLVAQKKAAGAI